MCWCMQHSIASWQALQRLKDCKAAVPKALCLVVQPFPTPQSSGPKWNGFKMNLWQATAWKRLLLCVFFLVQALRCAYLRLIKILKCLYCPHQRMSFGSSRPRFLLSLKRQALASDGRGWCTYLLPPVFISTLKYLHIARSFICSFVYLPLSNNPK